MEHQNQINFFWSGDNWTYLHDLTIKSHIAVKNKPVIWIHGNTPKSKHFDPNGVTIANADDIVSISDFMKKGGNFKTASSLWRFTYLHKYGGWYADTDAVAVKNWYMESDWVLCKNFNDLISTGVMKVPAGEDMFLDMIDNLKYEWGNVKVFNESYKKFKGHTGGTVNGKLFFPFIWKDWGILLKPYSMDSMIDGYSIHLYHTMFEREGLIDNIDEWIKQHPHTLLGYIDKWIKELL